MTAVWNVETANNIQVMNIYAIGGSLIDPSVVSTAAHCVHGEDLRNAEHHRKQLRCDTNFVRLIPNISFALYVMIDESKSNALHSRW